VGAKPKKRSKVWARGSVGPNKGSVAGLFIAILLGTLSFVLLFPWNGLLPLFTVPLVVGALLGLLAIDLRESIVAGVVSGLIGSSLACVFYRFDEFLRYMERTSPAAVADVTGSLWQGFLIPLLSANPINDPRVGSLLVVLASTLLTVAFSAGSWWLAQRLGSTVDRRWLGLMVIVPLGVCLAYTVVVRSSAFVASISTEPAAESYAYDGVINLKTYYLIRGGANYYDAIIAAVAGDSRINEIKNNKWNGAWGVNSPSRVKPPTVFYLWATAGFLGASGIVWASLLLSIGLWALWYWALFPTLGQRALFIAPALFPLFVFHQAWFNLFLPDWWAVLMLMASAAFLIRRSYVASAAFAVAAAMCREVFVVYLMLVLVVAAVLWLRKRLAARTVAIFGVAQLAFMGLYAVHYAIAATYMGDVAVKENTMGNTLAIMGKPFEVKFLGATSYLMFPYGDAVMPAFVLAIIGAAGLFLLLREADLARLALSCYLILFLVFLATIGASSSYWGQDISPLAVTGCAVLLAGLDRLGKGPDATKS